MMFSTRAQGREDSIIMINYLVKIGDIEIDDNTYILPGSYRCFPVAKGKQWEDAAGGNHDEVYARKIEGTFILNSLSQQELDFFMDAYKKAKVSLDPNDRNIVMTVFVPTENTHRTIKAIAEMPDMTIWYIAEQVYYNDTEFTFKEC